MNYKYTELSKLAITALVVSALNACSVVRDQAQVDAVVKPRETISQSVRVFFGDKSQPISDYPRCSSSEWIERAFNGISCPATKAANELTLGNAPMPSGSVDLRNATQAELMTFSDLECKHHQAGIYSNQAATNLFSSLTSLALTSASAITSRGMGPNNTSRNLAAGGSFFGAGRGLINSEVYFSYIGPAVVSEIDLIRRQSRADILAKQRCSVGAYPPARAINDALNYHETCSFIAGLSSLLKKAGVQKRDDDPTHRERKNVVDARILEINTTITRLQEAKTAAATAKDVALVADLQGQIEMQQRELLRWKDVSTLVGEAKPSTLSYDPSSFKSQIETQRLNLEVKQNAFAALAALPTGDAKKVSASEAVEDAKKELSDALNKQAAAIVIDRRIQEYQVRISALSQRIYEEQKKTSPSAALVKQWNDDRKIETDLLAALHLEQIKLGLPDGYADQFSEDVCLAP